MSACGEIHLCAEIFIIISVVTRMLDQFWTTVNSHETRNSSARGSLVLRSQNINLKQKRYKKENAERLLKIGPFFSFLYNFSSLVNKTILQRVFLFVFMSCFISSILHSMALMFYQGPFNHACNDNQILPAKQADILTCFNFKSWHLWFE